MNERFYLLKIQLVDIESKIWRRFVMPASITLDRLLKQREQKDNSNDGLE